MLANFLSVLVLYVLIIVLAFAGGTTYSDGQSVPSPLIFIPAILLFIYALGILVPSFAIVWRRLHDAGYSGGYYFLSFLPFGSIVVLVFTLMPAKPEGARFDEPQYQQAYQPYTPYPPQSPPPPGPTIL